MKLIIVATLFVMGTLLQAGPKTIKVKTDRFISFDGVISPRTVNPALKRLKKLANSTQDIVLYLNSPGGSVFSGLRFIHEMEKMKALGTKFICVVDDMAASMAFQFLIHCDTKYAFKYSAMLWHPVRINSNNTSITPKLAQRLATDLRYTENVLLEQLFEALPISRKVFFYHYHAETLHYGISIQKMMPKFINVIDGFKNPMEVHKAVASQKPPPSILDIFRGLNTEIDSTNIRTLIDYTFKGE